MHTILVHWGQWLRRAKTGRTREPAAEGLMCRGRPGQCPPNPIQQTLMCSAASACCNVYTLPWLEARARVRSPDMSMTGELLARRQALVRRWDRSHETERLPSSAMSPSVDAATTSSPSARIRYGWLWLGPGHYRTIRQDRRRDFFSSLFFHS